MNNIIAILVLLAVAYVVLLLVVGALRVGKRDVEDKDNLRRIADALDPPQNQRRH